MEETELAKISRVRHLAVSGKAERIRNRARASFRDIADAIAERIGVAHVSPATVFRWESGQNRPTGAYAVAYCDVLDELAQAVR